MDGYIRRYRDEIYALLVEQKFSAKEIEHAFFVVSVHNDTVGKKGSDKTLLTIVNDIISAKSIHTYILQETLYAILKNWDDGKVGKVSGKNIELYKNACKSFYDEIVTLLGRTAVGTSALQVKQV